MSGIEPLTGRCECGDLDYVLLNPPLFCHACHCLDCQRSSGSAFALTCIVIAADLQLNSGRLEDEVVSARSTASVCAACQQIIMIRSRAFKASARLQTHCLDDPRRLRIGAHIWTCRKHDWLALPADVPAFTEAYDRAQVWSKESLERLEACVADHC